MGTLQIVKIGGKVVDEPSALKEVLYRFSRLSGKKILVHGGGKGASALAKRLSIPTRMVEGRRITDAETLQVVQMVYAGLLNTNIVAGLQALKVNAMGMTGADGNVILSQKRPVGAIDFGFVGDVQRVNVPFVKMLLEQEVVPVFCALTHDGQGQILNTNADTIATELAVALSPYFSTELIFTFEKDGVLRDVNDAHSVINRLSHSEFLRLKKEGVIQEGMIPKLENAFRSLQKGVKKVRILNALNLSAPDSGKPVGTTITLE